jgi:hypothetical protein
VGRDPHLHGRGHVHQHDHSAEPASGTGALYEGARPWELFSSEESQCMNLQFSRELLQRRTAEISEACARGVDPSGPAMQMLSGQHRLFEVADELGPSAAVRNDAGRLAR